MQFKKGSAFTKVLSLALAIMVSASSLLGGTAFAAETSVQDASTVNTLSTAANAEEEEDFTVVENYALTIPSPKPPASGMAMSTLAGTTVILQPSGRTAPMSPMRPRWSN